MVLRPLLHVLQHCRHIYWLSGPLQVLLRPAVVVQAHGSGLPSMLAAPPPQHGFDHGFFMFWDSQEFPLGEVARAVPLGLDSHWKGSNYATCQQAWLHAKRMAGWDFCALGPLPPLASLA